jgi:hypothetical protein
MAGVGDRRGHLRDISAGGWILEAQFTGHALQVEPPTSIAMASNPPQPVTVDFS